jgi:hypothetical protein
LLRLWLVVHHLALSLVRQTLKMLAQINRWMIKTTMLKNKVQKTEYLKMATML